MSDFMKRGYPPDDFSAISDRPTAKSNQWPQQAPSWLAKTAATLVILMILAVCVCICIAICSALLSV